MHFAKTKIENHVFLLTHLLDNIHLITFYQTFIFNGLSRLSTPWLLPIIGRYIWKVGTYLTTVVISSVENALGLVG
jgi:hypothetical protein